MLNNVVNTNNFQHESQYVMSEEYSAKTVRDFIYNFTRKSLKRTLRSRVFATHTHHFNTTNVSESVNHADDKYASKNTQNVDESVYITDLTTYTFKKFVRAPGTVSLSMILFMF